MPPSPPSSSRAVPTSDAPSPIVCRLPSDNLGAGAHLPHPPVGRLLPLQALSLSVVLCLFLIQVYSPNYILPSTKCCSDEMGMDLSWVEQIDPHDSHFLAIAIAEQQLMNAEFDDCMTSNSSGATCCRSIALILMVLLLIRHVIVIVRDINMLQDATMLFSFAGFFLPCYVIARSCYAFQHRRRRQWSAHALSLQV
ncbi:hypothetical protein ZWY2020_017014 [Hordeum vulgare]|nr:hypothetical protein ZWY2020_017014 [Hordeum vulgare]